jgi:asparagine synthase (glutamine-hydrolysing)
MCGIAGLWQTTAHAEALQSHVRAMMDALTHRGPDAHGLWCAPDARLALGHRRLSIVDLSPEGAQPMVSASGRFVMVFNGEVYNHRALRQELAATGAQFRGTSDTEVMLAAVDAWGMRAMLERACGMFAIALHDRERQTLTLARDRAGEKPLYYGRSAAGLMFASELKAFAAVPGLLGDLDMTALAGFLRLSYVPGPATIWRNVWKLEPGHMRTFMDGGPTQGEVERYWDLERVIRDASAHPLDVDHSEGLGALDAVLREVIGEQMVADVPLGALLSGGLDSSLVVSIMQALADRPVRTFTIGFSESGFDESPHARAVAAHLGTAHAELQVTADDARRVIPLLPDMYDEPFADSSAIPTYLVSKLARSHVTVALSGDGGDETFGGYTRYLWAQQAWRMLRPMPGAMRSSVARVLLARPTEAWDRTAERVAAILPKRLRQTGTGAKVHKLAMLAGAASFDDVYEQLISNWWDGHAVLRPAQGRASALPPWLAADALPTDPLSRMQVRDFHAYLVDDVLVKVDRASMAVSLETRAPFIDRRVVELAWRIPTMHRVRRGQGKWLLRQLLYRYVPQRIVDRPKQGFGIPVAAWLRGPLVSWGNDLVHAVQASDPHLDATAVQRAWQHFLAQRGVPASAMWNLLMFLAWRTRWHRL